jgi:hypothetical protein
MPNLWVSGALGIVSGLCQMMWERDELLDGVFGRESLDVLMGPDVVEVPEFDRRVRAAC